ncbi:MAG: hypothetical protein AB7T63_05155 [Planctomycetota bacterium]
MKTLLARLSAPVLATLVALALACAVPPAAPHPARADDKGEEPPPAAAGDDEPEIEDIFEGATTFTSAQVETAIKKGLSWLGKKRRSDGSWGEIEGDTFYGGDTDDGRLRGYGHPAGVTSLVLYTLLKCGVAPGDPSIKGGFRYLEDSRLMKPRGAYESSMLLLALTATADPFKTSAASKQAEGSERYKLKGKHRRQADDLVKHLVKQRFVGSRGWRYFINETPAPGGPEDMSSTQLAALALMAAQRAGLRVDKDVWEDILAYSMAQQATEGPEVEILDPADRSKTYKARSRGFSYIKGDSDLRHALPSGSMTACALANIEMARYSLRSGKGGREAWDARPDAARVQAALYDGLAWLHAHWSPFANPQPGGRNDQGSYHIYYLYAVERAMDLLGLKAIDRHPWYSEMGQELLNRQFPDGHWGTGSTHEPNDVLDTCFALLFLKRATTDVIAFPSFTNGSGDASDNR